MPNQGRETTFFAREKKRVSGRTFGRTVNGVKKNSP